MKFRELKEQTAADLRKIASELEEKAKQVDEGDVNVVFELVEDQWELWRQMLLLRLANRFDQKRNAHSAETNGNEHHD